MAKSNRDRPIWKGCQTGKEADEFFYLESPDSKSK